jgi:predicted enzyme related to lactoylglutathione lyase
MANKLSEDTNALNWFEIPVNDLDRAASFYETIFDIKLMRGIMGPFEMAAFPSRPPHSSGSLVKSEMHKPSAEGQVVYLNGNPDLQLVLDKVEQAGGKVVLPKTVISAEAGFMALIIDTEGNKVGIHSGHL